MNKVDTTARDLANDLFTRTMDLAAEHGSEALLASISMLAKCRSEDKENVCTTCRLTHAQLHLELEQLQERMNLFIDALDELDPED